MKRVSHIQEIELCKKAQQGDKHSSDRMITHNLGLVHKITNKFYIRCEQYDYDDLFQEGIFGLHKAIMKFNSKAGCRFSTYAYYWVYAFVSRFNRNCSGKIRIPSHVYDKITKCETEEDKNLITSNIPTVTSLNKIIGDGTELESIVCDNVENEYEVEYNVMKDTIADLLSDRELQVIEHRYGLNGKHKLTHRECGEMFNISYGAIYLIEKKAIKKLQQHYNTNG